jgi:hypothetical protein
VTRIAIALLASTLLASPASAAERVTVFVFAEPDPALGGLVSAGLLDSAEDLRDHLRRTGGGFFGGAVKVTKNRADATMLVQVTGRSVVNEEYRVNVHVTLPDGTERDLVGTDVRQWKRCMLPIAAALRDLARAANGL